MNELEKKIEQTRKDLLTTAREQGLSSCDTIRLSVELDRLLNAYDLDKQKIERYGCMREGIG